jgi:hypothetical protein
MKVRTILAIAAAAVGLTSTAVADKYDDLAKQGYRWINTDGPLACPSKDDVQRMIKDISDTHLESERDGILMVEKLRAYFLVQGAIVQVVQEDKASDMTQFSEGGLNGTFWTLNKFLSKRPIRNMIGIIETPLNPASPTVNILGTNETAMPGATATPGETATPSASPTP